jgi:micrococcal nuclease
MGVSSFSPEQLHQYQRPLTNQHRQLRAELERLGRRRARLLRRGRAAKSVAQQRVLARQVQTTQREIAILRHKLGLAEKQIALIRRLLLARELVAFLSQERRRGLWDRIDWPALIQNLRRDREAEAADLARLAQVVEMVETAVAPHIPQSPPEPPPEKKDGDGRAPLVRVERVIDGDTIVIAGGERVRYIGVDCPEMVGLDGKPEPYAAQATARNRRLVEGKKVRLVRDSSQRDRYGRLLRYVYLGRRQINAQLVREGLAYAFIVPPDTAQAERLQQLEAEAQRLGRGVWKG